MTELLEALLNSVAIAAGLLLLSAVAVAILGPEPAGRPRGSWSGRASIVIGSTLILAGMVFPIRFLLPELPWHWLRGYRSGAGCPVELWQLIAVSAGLSLMGLRMIALGLRMRRKERAERAEADRMLPNRPQEAASREETNRES